MNIKRTVFGDTHSEYEDIMYSYNENPGLYQITMWFGMRIKDEITLTLSNN